MATTLAGHLSGDPAMTGKTGGNGENSGASSTISSATSQMNEFTGRSAGPEEDA